MEFDDLDPRKSEDLYSAISIMNWLLPWIALIAQLPFEAGGWLDPLSACLVADASFILQESQQCPMRANQRIGELASLIVLADRQNFWKITAKDLKNTRRGFTYSFLAQVLLAFVSYLITFATAVHDSLGSAEAFIQFASSSAWSWMFPIVFGYVRVGSQCNVGAIKEALVDNRAIPQYDLAGDTLDVPYQKGLRPNADL
ncbi:hypothetical protein K438DRAFT_2029243, partial [Mycena galopus ATCC 62051]